MYPIYLCMVIVRLLVGGAGRVGAAIQNVMHMCAVCAVADKHINIMWTTWPNALPLRRKGIGRSTTLCFGPRIAQLLVRCALCRKVCYVLLYVCIFRVGSRAEVVTAEESVLRVTIHVGSTTTVPTAETLSVEAEGPRTPMPRLRKSAGLPGNLAAPPTVIATILCVVGTLMLLVYMMPGTQGMMPQGGRGDGGFNYRIPPSWNPNNDHHYSFRAYMTDVSLWVMLTDLQPHQQCAAIIMRLQGPAADFARQITPQEIIAGGQQEGIQMDPVTYVLAALQRRFAALEEETRLQSMTEMLAFARRPGETINTLLARHEIVRGRAANEGRFTMSVEGVRLADPQSRGHTPGASDPAPAPAWRPAFQYGS